jgi:hypothetical protein
MVIVTNNSTTDYALQKLFLFYFKTGMRFREWGGAIDDKM